MTRTGVLAILIVLSCGCVTRAETMKLAMNSEQRCVAFLVVNEPRLRAVELEVRTLSAESTSPVSIVAMSQITMRCDKIDPQVRTLLIRLRELAKSTVDEPIDIDVSSQFMQFADRVHEAAQRHYQTKRRIRRWLRNEKRRIEREDEE